MTLIVPKLILLSWRFNSIIPVLFTLCNSARQHKRMMVGGLGTLHYLFPVENSQFSINIPIFVTQQRTEKQYKIVSSFMVQ